MTSRLPIALLLVTVGCGSVDHPGADVKLEFTGFDELTVVPPKTEITKVFKLRVLGNRTSQTEALGATTLRPLNQVRLRIFSPEGVGQVYDRKRPKATCAASPYLLANDIPRGGHQFVWIRDAVETEVCTPFDILTDKYGEVHFGVKVQKITSPVSVNVIVIAGLTIEMRTVHFVPEGYTGDLSITADASPTVPPTSPPPSVPEEPDSSEDPALPPPSL